MNGHSSIFLYIIYKEHCSQLFICPRWLNSYRQRPCGKNFMQRPGQMIENPVICGIRLFWQNCSGSTISPIFLKNSLRLSVKRYDKSLVPSIALLVTHLIKPCLDKYGVACFLSYRQRPVLFFSNLHVGTPSRMFLSNGRSIPVE